MTIDWPNKIVNIPKTDLTLVSGTLYTLDTLWFKETVKAFEASMEGMPFVRVIDHNTYYTVAGVTYARKIEVINGYKVKFEDGQYSVILEGSNNNIFDVGGGVLYQNQVQVIPTNSAGLIQIISGSGVTEQDKLDIADRVWDEMMASHGLTGSFGLGIADILGSGGGLTPEQAAQLQQILDNTDKKLLTKALWLALK